jgi:hypothetical protein
MMAGQPEPGFGPWASGLDDAERLARFRSIRALAIVFTGPASPLVFELRDAESNPNAATRALTLLEALPPLRRRRLLSVYLAVHQAARLRVPKAMRGETSPQQRKEPAP